MCDITLLTLTQIGYQKKVTDLITLIDEQYYKYNPAAAKKNKIHKMELFQEFEYKFIFKEKNGEIISKCAEKAFANIQCMSLIKRG